MTVTPKFTGFIGTPDGERRLVEGEEWADDDPFVVANPDAFTELEPACRLEPEAHPKPPRTSTRRETRR